MNIICDKNILNEAVAPAASAVSNKNTNQALEGVLITANKDEGTLVICGYDMEKGIQVTVSGEGVEINESGSIIVNAAKFSSIIKNLPDGNVSVTTDAKHNMNIKINKSEFDMHGLDSAVYPLIPELKGERNFKLPRKTLKNMIASTISAAAVSGSRPALTGVLFEITDNQVNVVGCDGNRLSVKRSFDELRSNEELDIKFNIPKKSLSELLKLLNDDETAAEIELTNKHVIISIDNIIYFSRLIESEYLDYKRVINMNPKTTVVMNTKNFLTSVERAAVLTDDNLKTPVKLSFIKQEANIENKENAGILKIDSESSIGKVNDEFDIEMEGENIVMGFNYRYIYEALKSVKEEKILINLETPKKSLAILPYDEGKIKNINAANADNFKFIYLVQPVLLSA